jgi:hypothetical protein
MMLLYFLVARAALSLEYSPIMDLKFEPVVLLRLEDDFLLLALRTLRFDLDLRLRGIVYKSFSCYQRTKLFFFIDPSRLVCHHRFSGEDEFEEIFAVQHDRMVQCEVTIVAHLEAIPAVHIVVAVYERFVRSER